MRHSPTSHRPWIAMGGRLLLLACVAGLSLVAGAGGAGAAKDEPIKLTDDVTPPERTVFVKPEYPEAARKDGTQGKVTLEIVVNKTGDVTDTRVLQSVPVFDEAAVRAVRQWKYKPALRKEKPVTVYLTVTVEFKLK